MIFRTWLKAAVFAFLVPISAQADTQRRPLFTIGAGPISGCFLARPLTAKATQGGAKMCIQIIGVAITMKTITSRISLTSTRTQRKVALLACRLGTTYSLIIQKATNGYPMSWVWKGN